MELRESVQYSEIKFKTYSIRWRGNRGNLIDWRRKRLKERQRESHCRDRKGQEREEKNGSR